MPHNEGVQATVVRLDDVLVERNLFGRYDAKVYERGAEEPSTVIHNVCISIADPATLSCLNLTNWSSCYADVDDIVLVRECKDGLVSWYKVTYAYTT